MNISIFGLGYVGAVSAACFARRGHAIVGVDVNPDKCAMILRGQSPIVETGLDELLKEGVDAGRITATTSAEEAVTKTDVSIISVGTPSYSNGSHNYAYLERVCEQIGDATRRKGKPHVVVIRSTVMPGTTDRMAQILRERAAGVPIHVGFNPEFLREGSAIKDFDQPAYTIVGADGPEAEAAQREMYASVEAPVHVVAIRVAEMMKAVANAFHALKITFANEVGLLSKELGVDGREVMRLICEDKVLNISPAYMRPGFAYGGSCLPKDVAAINYAARINDLELPLLGSLPQSNRSQIERVTAQLLDGGHRRIAVLGLAFKPGTDDLRESPALELVERLLGKGCQLRIFDRAVQHAKLVGANKEYLERKLPHVTELLTDDATQLFDGATAVVVTYGSKEFVELLAHAPKNVHVYDLVGLNIPAGFTTHGIAWNTAGNQ